MDNQGLELQALKLLESKPNITQRDLSLELGVSLGKTHYVVKALIDVGWVKLENFRRSDNKIGYSYLLTPKGIRDKVKISRQFLIRKQNEYEQLRVEIEQLKTEIKEKQSGDNNDRT